jgi:2-amino-4-hydroxy-6-hydroxymethyldihydropteridine diphosphokinase
MSTAYLGLGSNEGNRRRHLRAAVGHLRGHDAISGVSASPVYETEAHTRAPEEEQPPFLNAVLRVHVECAPESLLRLAQAVEREEGRTRNADRTWQPRPLDVDLLAVGTKTRRTDTLTLPHPRLAERRFVLRPWADLAPNFAVPPPFDESVQSLLDQCADATDIRRVDLPLRDVTDALAASDGAEA